MDPLDRVNYSLNPVPGATGGRDHGKEEGFLDTLKGYYSQVDRQMKEANQIAEEFAVGKRHDLHEIMIASEKADLSFKLLLKVRNKLIEAYQEIMRMQF